MRLERDPAYVEREARAPFRLCVFFIVLIAGCIFAAAANAKLSTHIMQSVAFVISSNLFYRMHRTRREGANTRSVIYTSKDDRLLNLHGRGSVVTIPLSEVTKVSLRYRRSEVSSILIKTRSGRKVRIARYQNMPALAALLESTTKAENLKVATRFHL